MVGSFVKLFATNEFLLIDVYIFLVYILMFHHFLFKRD